MAPSRCSVVIGSVGKDEGRKTQGRQEACCITMCNLKTTLPKPVLKPTENDRLWGRRKIKHKRRCFPIIFISDYWLKIMGFVVTFS